MDSQGEKLLEELNKILVNLYKSPNRRYLRRTLVDKLQRSKALYENLLEHIELVPSEKEQKFLLESARVISANIRRTILGKLELDRKLVSFKTLAKVILIFLKIKNKFKMTTTIEMIKLVTSLVQPYDGGAEKLDSVVDALNTLKSLVTADNRAATVQAIISRFTGKARLAMPQILPVTTIDELVTALKNKCSIKANPDTVIAKLNVVKQSGDITKFTDEVERLTLELEKAYIQDDVPIAVASSLATKAGTKALISGLKNPEAKLILKAGQFNTLTNAVQKAIEHSVEQQNAPATQVLNFNNNQNNKYRNNNNIRNNNGYRNNQDNRYNNDRHRNNYNNNHRNFNSSNNNIRYNNNSSNNNNNRRYYNKSTYNNRNNDRFNNNRQSNGSLNNQRRMYVADANEQNANSTQRDRNRNENGLNFLD